MTYSRWADRMRVGLAPRTSYRRRLIARFDLSRAVWIKVRNPARIAVQLERSQMWNR
jgi:hypothetical protein